MEKEIRRLTIGERILSLRKEYHLTQVQLGEISGLHGSNISRIEKGAVFPSGDVVLKMADYFQVSCDYILGKPIIEKTSTVGYILNGTDGIQIIEVSENDRLRELKHLYCAYLQLNDMNRKEILEYIRIKIKYQN